MRIKILMTMACATLMLSACSEGPNEAPEKSEIEVQRNIEYGPGESVVGHWLFNPGQCNSELQFVGMYDLKIDGNQIIVGDIGAPMRGEWSTLDEKASANALSRASDWAVACDDFNLVFAHSSLPGVKRFQGRHHDIIFIPAYDSGTNEVHWILASDDDLQWFVPFNLEKLGSLPVADDIDIENSAQY